MFPKRQLPYDKKYLIRCLAGLVGTAALMKVTGGSGFVVILPLMLAAAFQRKSENLLFLLSISLAMLVGNSTLMPKGGLFGYAQRAALVAVGGIAILQISGQRSSPLAKPFLSIMGYLLFMAMSSAMGWCPFISYLKLFLFFMVYFAYYGVTNSIAESHADNIRRVRSIFLSLACFFIFGSVILTRFPGIGQMSGEAYLESLKYGGSVMSLFCGMTFHSQSLGPTCALLGVALFADMVFGIRRADRLYLFLLVSVPFLIWKTASRTAMGSFIAGLGICVMLVMNARFLRSGWKSKIINGAFAIFITAAVAVLVIPQVRDKMANFIVKYAAAGESVQVTSEDVFSSRRGKWEEGIYNFKKSPVFGNGFQVDETMIGLKPNLKTLSAPIEKSTWVTAILEEGGVVGFAIFIVFAFTVIARLKRQRAYIGLSCFVVFLIINLGEFTMFSMSGIGGFSWGIVFIAVMLDSRRLQEEKMGQQQRMPPPQWSWR